jgi:serine/threonine-protein kinase
MKGMPGAQPLRIVGRYELHSELASGGMATVHLGRSIGAAGFAKSVAIKRLHAQFASDPEFVSQLLEEARLCERIRHPNVVAMLDVVAVEHELLLVMEYVHGETLARLLRACAQDGERCPPEVAASIAHDVLLGLHAAHSAMTPEGAPLCIIHRDVSPQNIIVGADGVARLLDFGIAKAAGAASHTREGEVKGKVPYMAPEILRLEEATPQSDVYSAAVTLWESLCARRLFRADTEVGVWGKVLDGAVPLPSTLVGPLGAVEDVVMRGLARSKADRFPTALAMAQALEASIRLASAAEVAVWVARRAADSLAERSSVIRAIERSAPRGSGAPVAMMASRASSEPPATMTPASGAPAAMPPSAASFAPAPEAPRGVRSWGRWGLAAMLVAAVIALVSLRDRAARRAGEDVRAPLGALPAASVVTEAPPPDLVPAAPPTGVPAAAAPSAASAEGAPPGVAASARPRRLLAPRAGADPAATTSATAARPRVAPDPCDPPYTLDEAGRKHFKLSCVN